MVLDAAPADGGLPAWLVSMLSAHVRTETNHKAMQRALHLLALPAAEKMAPAESRHADEAACTSAEWEHAAHMRAGGEGDSQAATVEPSADHPVHDRAARGDAASCSGRSRELDSQGGALAWAEVHALQERLADARHPQVYAAHDMVAVSGQAAS